MTRYICLGLPIFAVLFFGALVLRAAPDPLETVVFAEKFDSKLSEGWSWVREVADAWKVGNGELVLTVQPGYLNPWHPETHNVLVRELPADIGENWAIELKLESDPKTQFEHAGVLIYWDDSNYISLFRESLDGKPKLQMVTVKNNAPRFVVVDQNLKPVWLRLVVKGDEVTTQYRASEQDAWQTIGNGPRVASTKPRCGLTSGGGPKDAHRDAKFSHFQILRLTE